MNLEIELLPWQKEFLDSDKKIKALSGARGTGKSWLCRLHILINCLKISNYKVFVTASTHSQTYNKIIEPLISEIYNLRLDKFIKRNKQNSDFYNDRLRFQNGSYIEIISSDKLSDRLRSREFSM